MIARKPSFQGPPLILTILQHDWEAFVGDITGFVSTEEAPMLVSGAVDSTRMEAKSMLGTDESV